MVETKATPRRSRGRVRCALETAADFILGTEYFVAYASRDGSLLPQSICEKLRQEGFSVCLDLEDYHDGDDLDWLTRHRVRRSSCLILLVREHAYHSSWVMKEVQTAVENGVRILPISVNASWVEGEAGSNPFREVIGNLVLIPLYLRGGDGECPESALKRLVNEKKARQAKRWRLWGRTTALATTFALLFISIGFGLRSLADTRGARRDAEVVGIEARAMLALALEVVPADLALLGEARRLLEGAQWEKLREEQTQSLRDLSQQVAECESRSQRRGAVLKALDSSGAVLLDADRLEHSRIAFERAFIAYGLDFQTLGLEDAVARLLADAPLVRSKILNALDHWASSIRDDALRDKVLEVAYRATPDDVDRELRLARVNGDLDLLQAKVLEAEKRSFGPVTYYLLAWALRSVGDRDSSIRVLERGVLEHPDDFDLNSFLGELFLEQQPPNPVRGLPYLKASVALRSDIAEVWAALGRCYRLLGDARNAEEYLREALSRAPSLESELLLAQVLHEADRGREALAVLQEAAARLGLDVDAEIDLEELAATRFAAYGVDAARHAAARWLLRVGAVWSQAAELRLEGGDDDGARRAFQAALRCFEAADTRIDASAKTAVVYFHLAGTCETPPERSARAECLGLAIAHYERQAAPLRADPDWCFKIAATYAEKERLDAAEELVRRGRRLEPSESRWPATLAYVLLLRSHESSGAERQAMLKEARDALAEARAIDPATASVQLFVNEVFVLANLGLLDEAQGVLREARSRHPKLESGWIERILSGARGAPAHFAQFGVTGECYVTFQGVEMRSAPRTNPQPAFVAVPSVPIPAVFTREPESGAAAPSETLLAYRAAHGHPRLRRELVLEFGRLVTGSPEGEPGALLGQLRLRVLLALDQEEASAGDRRRLGFRMRTIDVVAIREPGIPPGAEWAVQESLDPLIGLEGHLEVDADGRFVELEVRSPDWKLLPRDPTWRRDGFELMQEVLEVLYHLAVPLPNKEARSGHAWEVPDPVPRKGRRGMLAFTLKTAGPEHSLVHGEGTHLLRHDDPSSLPRRGVQRIETDTSIRAELDLESAVPKRLFVECVRTAVLDGQDEDGLQEYVIRRRYSVSQGFRDFRYPELLD